MVCVQFLLVAVGTCLGCCDCFRDNYALQFDVVRCDTSSLFSCFLWLGQMCCLVCISGYFMLFVGWLCMEFCGSSSLVVCLSSCGVLRLDSVDCGVF